jgi:hypothetical protein
MKMILVGLGMIAVGAFGIYGGMKTAAETRGQAGVGAKLKRGSNAVTGFAGPAMLIALGLLLLYLKITKG